MSRTPNWRPPTPDGAQQHRDWLSLIEISGPFLSVPVLRATWPTLDPLDRRDRERLRVSHATWLADPGEHHAWIAHVLRDLLGWGDALHETGLDALAVEIAEHDATIAPAFALVEPGQPGQPGEPGEPLETGGPFETAWPFETAVAKAVRLLGMICPPGNPPTARVAGSAWAATTVDRLAHLCRRHKVELGLATDGRWWALVWAPEGGVTTTAVFDAVSWPEAAERHVVRAFVSLLCRRRFFGVPDAERLAPLLRASLDSGEEITEALGVQVRQAVELLVAAIGHADVRDRERGGIGVAGVAAHDVYRGAVVVMMRIVFLLFAEERGLLPADNDLYATAYSAGRLYDELKRRADEGTEEELEHSFTAWHRLLALFTAVYQGFSHPRLTMHGHDGSLFDPETYAWLPLAIDDRTVLHILRAVQYVEIGSGRSRELRRLTFRTLDVEQIGYVYEGLLSFEGFRADGVTVGLIGKEGLEEEVALADLETIAARAPDPPALAATLAEAYKDSRIGSVAALARRLAPLPAIEAEEARKRLLAVTGGDYPLAQRLLPFAGIIRADLRGLPVVVLPGALYITESALRRNTGTHYTPKFLAEEVVRHALEPLVYSPGPLQTADTTRWERLSSEEILALRVADIAMGSAAFLVAAARYLAAHLIEARAHQGDEAASAFLATAAGRVAGVDEDPVVVNARREIIEHCLYGVDINPMAVEMAKLSLWLVSMDERLPFTFLDDRLVAGDSLLGVTSLDQLEHMRLEPTAGGGQDDLLGWTKGVRSLVAEVVDLRRQLSAVEPGADPLGAIDEKRGLLAAARDRTAQLRLFADLTVGAALAGSRRAAGSRDPRVRVEAEDHQFTNREGLYAEAARLANEVAETGDDERARGRSAAWLRADQVPGSFDRTPLHWPLAFPEVFDSSAATGATAGIAAAGFDAIIGNPPFLGGQKITGTMGTAYREHLVEAIGGGARGSADLVAYFALRAHGLLNPSGQTGLIATNTLAQGDTREVGLDQIVAGGVTIRRAIKSRPWPSTSAVLEFCAVWTSRERPGDGSERVTDGVLVAGITPSLDPESRSTGNAHRLAVNADRSFQGSNLVGLGFTMEPGEAAALIEKDPRNAEALFPYLNGKDLNSRPDCSGSRWVINFHDWSEDRAKTYPDCYDQVKRSVKPERDTNNRKVYRDYWWHYAEKRPAMVKAISGLRRVIVITLVSRTAMPVMVPTGQVFAHKLGVFATDDTAMLALLSSAPHYWWAISRSSTMKTDLNYSPSDVFETLALPRLTPQLRELGERLDVFRRDMVMLARRAGLTATYNLVNDPACRDDDIAELRRVHRAIDEAVCRAYGWDDLVARGLDHGFHPVGRETRHTVGPALQREFVDRLLELNHERYADEVARGLHAKKKAGRRAAATGADEGALF